MKESKKFVKVYFTIVAVLLVVVMSIIFLVDPFYHYHMPYFGMEPDFTNNQTYKNPGTARHMEYDAVIIGSSLSENFNTKWFDEAYGISTLKLPNPAATVENLCIAIDMAEKNRDIKYVFGNLDCYTLQQKAGTTAAPLPKYLYDDNPFNDAQYILNKDILFKEIPGYIRRVKAGTNVPRETAYNWWNVYKTKFGKEKVISALSKSPSNEKIEQSDEGVSENTKQVVDRLAATIKKYPDTTFAFFYSPYSIAYWYQRYLNGEVVDFMSMMTYSMEVLLELDNVELYFPATWEMISDLDKYMDNMHYDMDIQYQIFEEIRDGKNQLTKENYMEYMNEFEEMILNCDFEEALR